MAVAESVFISCVLYESDAEVEGFINSARASYSDAKFVLICNSPMTKFLREVLQDTFCSELEVRSASDKRPITHRCTVIDFENNYGYANANNIALKLIYQTAPSCVAIVANPDIVFSEKSIDALIGAVRLHDDEVPIVCVPMITNEDGKHLVGMWRPLRSRRDIFLSVALGRDVDLGVDNSTMVGSGACMAASAVVWHRLGFLDGGTFLYYEEDLLAVRLAELDGQFVFVPKAEILHFGGASTGRRKSQEILSVQYKSATYFVKKTMPISRLFNISLYLFFRLRLIAITLNRFLSKRYRAEKFQF